MKYYEIAKEIYENNLIAGVRSLCEDEDYSVGDECRESYEWDIENDCSTYYTTGETAGGTCATRIEDHLPTIEEIAASIERAIEMNAGYGGKQVIIAGHSVNNDGYFDPEEVRIRNAWVLAVVE